MFEDRTQANIKAEALALLSPAAGVSALSGSYADATLGAVAGQLSELYQVLPAVVSMLFVDEYSGPYIDLVGKTYFNITRRPGTKARCSITLNGDAGTTLPAGTVFLTRSGLEFLLLESVTIPQGGTAEGTLEAAEIGAAYNVGAGEITRIVNAGRLRIKESDRLAAVREELNRLGARVTEGPDSLTIVGVETLSGGIADSHNDHRIAMMAAVAATRCAAPVTLTGAESVRKSYPDFWEDYARLGGKLAGV